MNIFNQLKKWSLLALLLCLATQLQAADVDLATAQKAAKSFMAKQVANGHMNALATSDLQLAKAEPSVAKPYAFDYYIFNGKRSYVVVAGDDQAPEILMYGTAGCIDVNNINPNMQWVLNKYKYQIDGLKAGTLKPNNYTPMATTAVAPLVNATWDQEAPYYNHTPTSGSAHAVTGCAATSLSMCFYRWKWPKTFPAVAAISGSYSGLAAPALPERTADWDNMLDHYGTWYDDNGDEHTASYTTAQGDAVAWLMRYAGQACKMSYSTSGSGAYDPDILDACHIFGYTNAQLLTITDGYAGNNQYYTDAQWNEWMLAELHAGRPIEYLASDPSAGGHAFNVFGCDTSGKYYVNWGWSGEDNGYCTLHNFTTGNNSTGQGGGSYTFNYGEAMIIGIQPPGPSISATPNSVNFTGYATNTYTQTITVIGSLLTDDITISKSGSNVYSVSPTTISAEDAENGVDVTVTYAPTAAGETTATLTLTSEGAETVTIPVTGVAQPHVPTIVIEPTSLKINAALSRTVTKTIDLTGVFLTNDVTVTLNDNNGVFTVSPTTISKNNVSETTPVTVSVSFNSETEGTFNGSVTFSSNGAESKTVQLTGTARDGGSATDAYLNIANYETIDEAVATVSGMTSIYKYTEYDENDCAWLTLSCYGAQKADATQNWFISTSLTQYSNSWNANDIFPGQTAYFGNNSAYSVYSSGNQSYYVTNCTQAKAYVKGGGYSSSSSATLAVYECTLNADGSLNVSNSPVDTKQGSDGIITSEDLDESKIYLVKLTGGGSYPDLLEIGFKTPISQLETPVATDATDVTASSFTANWNACAGADSYILQVMPKNYDILTEGFSKFTKTGAVEMSGSLDDYMDNAGWTGSKLYEAIGGIRLGTGSSTGTLTSPALDLSTSEGKVTVAFKAKTFNNDVNCNLKISCGNNTQTVTLPDNNEASYNVVLDCNATAGQKITFATTANGKRVIITSIHIMDGDHGTTSLKSIDIDGITINGITDNKYTVTDLDPNTTYIYDVKAVYGTKQSKWSNKINVTTLNEDVEPGITLAELLETGVDGEQYTISNDLAVADVADYLDYAFLTDGQDNWICVNAAETELFAPFVNNGVIKGGTLKGVLSRMGLNPLFTANAEAQGADSEVDFTIEQMYLDDAFAPKVNQVIDVVGFWNANDGALRAYAPGGSQGPSLTLDYTWGAASNTLQNGLRYVVRCGINIKEPWHTAAGIAPRDYEYDFQNYIARAMRLPETPTGIGVIAIEDANTIVNVYTTQGQLIRQNVKVADATKNLPCGIYIVGNKKVVVK